MSDPELYYLPPLARAGHAGHVKRCLSGLPASQIDLDASRLAIGFYCMGSLDLLGMLQDKTTQTDRESWREWIWEQQTRCRYGSGFRPSPFMTPQSDTLDANCSDYDTPHIVMTYTALLSLSILRDDFSRLDRPGLVQLIKSCQRGDGSFSTIPGGVENDLRALYCAFCVSQMLNDWSGIDIDRALSFIASCRTTDGAYGQSPFCEAHGGPTYIAIASLHLAPSTLSSPVSDRLTPYERRKTIHWLVHNQDSGGGFRGRTNKDADACYCFWCGAALEILGAKHLVDSDALCKFIASCQFKFGGISKTPGEHPDPYHTYLSLAALSMYPPGPGSIGTGRESWDFEPLDPLLNARKETSLWAREHIPDPKNRPVAESA